MTSSGEKKKTLVFSAKKDADISPPFSLARIPENNRIFFARREHSDRLP